MDTDKFIETVEKMSAAELNELVKALEEKFGVSAAAFAAAAPAAGDAEEAEEKDAFTIVLKKTGDQKIQVIKVLKQITGLGLKEVKDMTDKEDVVVKEDVKKEEAEEFKQKLIEAGAVVELK
jgi:large subunit ribosomal protein L7/L12